MSAGGVTIVRHSSVKPGKDDEFAAWRGRLLARLREHPGFLRVETHPPDSTQPDWVTVEHFEGIDEATAWLESPARAELLTQAEDILEGGDCLNILVNPDRPTRDVTAVITNEVAPGAEKQFLDWQRRIQIAQERFPGYRGVDVQAPIPEVNPAWVTLLRFDTADNLRGWLESPECKRLTDESQGFLVRADARVSRVSFSSLLPTEEQVQAPPDWKVNMIVLLVLYPVVMITLVFIDRLFPGMSMGPLTFINNVIGVSVTGFLLIPWAAGRLRTWLSPDPATEPRTTIVGTALIVLAYIVLIVVMSAMANRFS